MLYCSLCLPAPAPAALSADKKSAPMTICWVFSLCPRLFLLAANKTVDLEVLSPSPNGRTFFMPFGGHTCRSRNSRCKSAGCRSCCIFREIFYDKQSARQTNFSLPDAATRILFPFPDAAALICRPSDSAKICPADDIPCRPSQNWFRFR